MELSKLKELYHGTRTVYGPYKRKDGRLHLVLYDGVNRRTLSYPKALVEISIGRVLVGDETVDHIDRDFTNNSLDNLRVVDKSTHSKEDSIKVKVGEIICPMCFTKFIPTRHQRAKRYNHLAGPFCSKPCVSQHFIKMADGGTSNPRSRIEVKYYRFEKAPLMEWQT